MKIETKAIKKDLILDNFYLLILEYIFWSLLALLTDFADEFLTLVPPVFEVCKKSLLASSFIYDSSL